MTTASLTREGPRISSSSGVVAEIKSKLPVADLVGETVALKRAGTILKGICPFHGEKTPSFTVTPERDTWHCFGCGEHGDVFTFVMRRDGLDFREALARLAERTGVELSAHTAGEDRRRRRLREALEAAIAWYREVMLQARQAERARAYLAERGLTEATQERFGLGYAPNTWEALSTRLRAKGFTDAEMTDAGLASPSTRGGVYDRFRGRIIIPIRDASGRAIGLGGRILPDAEGPKYLNSPATALFDKSSTLYGIDLAKGAIRREKLAVIVEGYTDVMAAHQAGFENVVASLGTALTAGQVDLALRYADAVALAYDVDVAGDAATQRGILQELGPDVASKVRVIRVPQGKDPDELIRNDPDAWAAAVQETQAKNLVLMDYFLERETLGAGTGVTERVRAAERVLTTLARMPASLLVGTYVQELARRLDLDEQDLRRQYDLIARGVPAAAPRVAHAPAAPGQQPSSLSPLEREAMTLLLLEPGLAVEVIDANGTDEANLPMRDELARALAEAWLRKVRSSDGPPAIEEFVAGLDPVTGGLARDLLASARARGVRVDPQTDREALRVVLLRLRKERVLERLADLQALIVAGSGDGEGDSERVGELERQFQALHLEREQLEGAINPSAALVGTRRA